MSKQIIYNILETELLNQHDIKTDLLFKFNEIVADNCKVTIETKDIVPIYHSFILASKSKTNPIHPDYLSKPIIEFRFFVLLSAFV